MIETIQVAGLASALPSCAFWLAGACVRFRPSSLSTLRGPNSMPVALQRQSLLNASAAIFAAGATAAQAVPFYLQISS